jgi:putative DNA-binding protein
VNLKEFQHRFQRAILERDDAILKDIPDGPHETKDNLLGIYRDAYLLRLVEVIGNDHEMLRSYAGDDTFGELARAYVACCPSQHPNARWVSRRLPEFLRDTEPYASRPVLADLAALERALNDAFDGPDAPVLTLGDLAAIPPNAWPGLVFHAHPTAQCLYITSNAADVWTALKADTKPPEPDCDGARAVLVWRHKATAMFRQLDAEEAMMWVEAAKDASFGTLCEMLAAYDCPDTASVRAAGYLKCWLETGLLTAIGTRV